MSRTFEYLEGQEWGSNWKRHRSQRKSIIFMELHLVGRSGGINWDGWEKGWWRVTDKAREEAAADEHDKYDKKKRRRKGREERGRGGRGVGEGWRRRGEGRRRGEKKRKKEGEGEREENTNTKPFSVGNYGLGGVYFLSPLLIFFLLVTGFMVFLWGTGLTLTLNVCNACDQCLANKFNPFPLPR